MDNATFWAIVDDTRGNTNRETEVNLCRKYKAIGIANMNTFVDMVYKKTAMLDNTDVRELYFGTGSISSDSYTDFLNAIVARGEACFEAVLKEPSPATLGKYFDTEDAEMIGFECYASGSQSDILYPTKEVTKLQPVEIIITDSDAKARSGIYNKEWFWHIRETGEYYALYVSGSPENEGGVHITTGSYVFVVHFLTGYMFNDKTCPTLDPKLLQG